MMLDVLGIDPPAVHLVAALAHRLEHQVLRQMLLATHRWPPHQFLQEGELRVEAGVHLRADATRQILAESRSRFSVHVSRSEEHTSELQSLMRISYAVFCLKKKKHT